MGTMQQTMDVEIHTLDLEVGTREVDKAPIEALYAMPSTKGQERFWSLDQLNPGNPALNMPLMWRCTGPLDVDLMSRAFTLLVERHESLRTTFDFVEEQVTQIIGAPWSVPIPVVDLGDVSDAESTAERLTNEHAAYRMDLRTGPLMFTKLLRFGPANHMLLVTLHHIICDGVSTGVLLRDVTEIYKALLEGKEARLPELPIQLADFAIWQQQWLEGPEYSASLDFWRKSLGTNFSRIELQHDAVVNRKALPKDRTQAGAIETHLIGGRLTERVHEFCKRNYITPNVFFSSVFSLLLNRISGQNDLLIGSPCANRMLQTENLVGMFMNIQAMRVKLGAADTFMTLIEKVKSWTIQAYENQQLPFEDLIYDPYFAAGNSSLELPIFFLYQKSFMVTHKIGDLTIVPLRSMSPGAAFEVMFAVVDREEEGPRLQFEYNPLNFRVDTVRHYLDLYVQLLESALNAPASLLDHVAPVPSSIIGRRTEDEGATKRGSEFARIGSTAIAREGGKAPRRELAPENRTYQDAIEFQLVEMWQATLDIPYISVEDGFFSLGVSSLSALRLITKMNRAYSTHLGLSSLFSAPSIRAIAALIRDRLSPNMHSSLVPIQPLGTKPPLFAVHGVRGNVLSFYGLAMHLGKDQPVYGLQAQALVTGEPALLRLPDMAAYYIAEMRKVQPKGPYNLLGYSFGGTVVLEMAQQLRAAGEEVGLLGMLDSKSPAYMKALSKSRAAAGKKTRPEPSEAAEVIQISRTERLNEIVGKVRSRLIRIACHAASLLNMKTIPAYMKDAASINYVANSNYEPTLYDGRMTLFRATRQVNPNASEDLGWGTLFTGGVDIRELPGTHETLWSEQNVGAFATSLTDSLESSELIQELSKAG